MEKPSASRATPVVLILFLLTAAAVIMIYLGRAWLAGGQSCGEDGCLAALLQHWNWLSFPARSLFCLIPALLLMVPATRRPKRNTASRFWPLYFFLILSAVLVGLEFSYAAVAAAMAGALSQPGTMSLAQQLSYVVFFSPPVSTVAGVLVSWSLVSWRCFTPEAGPADAGSRSRRALFAYSLFAALAMLGLGWLHVYLLIFTDSDYMVWVSTLERASGVDVNWSILLTPMIMALPVWAVAWRRDPGGRGLRRIIPVVLLALLLGATYALIGLLVAVLFLSGPMRRPEDFLHLVWGWSAWILAANALAAWTAHVIVHGRRPKRSAGPGRRATLSRVMLTAGNGLVIVGFYGVVGVILAGKLGWTGTQPLRVIAAGSAGPAQIGTPYEGRCDGMVRAGGKLWYVGYGDFWTGLKKLEKNGSVINISAVAAGMEDQPYRAYSDHFTMLSRLTPDGSLESRFYVRGSACLIPVPGSSRMLLMTSLRQEGSGSPVTFESLDGGRDWHKYAGGALAEVGLNGAYSQVDFVSPDEIWLTYSPYEWDRREPYIGVSKDGGETAGSISIPSKAVSSPEDVAVRLPSGSRIETGGNRHAIYYLTHVSANKAVLWVSQKIGYRTPEDGGKSRWHQALRTDMLVLDRRANGWAVGRIRHIDDLYIDKLVQPPGGPAYAVLDQARRRGVAARLNGETLHWDALSDAPNPFWPLGESNIRDLWASRHALVVEVRAGMRPPRWLRSGALGRLSISAQAYYYSNNDGANWHKLAIDSYPGVLGMDGTQDRLYFQNYSRRSGTSPVYAFDLKP